MKNKLREMVDTIMTKGFRQELVELKNTQALLAVEEA
jgi:hypothetical protein